MTESCPKSIRRWREACNLSEDDLALMVGTGARTIRHWEYAGYDPAAQCGLALAAALGTTVDAIEYGRYVRGLALSGHQFILSARGRDDWGWRARIAEWGADGTVDPWFAAQANDGWLESGLSAESALDRVERGIRSYLEPSRRR